MHKLHEGRQIAVELLKAFFDEIFDGFDVVVGDFLNFLYSRAVFLGEVPIDVAQGFKQGSIKVLQLGNLFFAQSDEIFNFNTYSILHQSPFGEESRK